MITEEKIALHRTVFANNINFPYICYFKKFLFPREFVVLHSLVSVWCKMHACIRAPVHTSKSHKRLLLSLQSCASSSCKERRTLVSKQGGFERYLREGSVYVHYPYCKQLCSYCAFVKFVPKKGTPWTIDDEVLENAMVSHFNISIRLYWVIILGKEDIYII